MVNKHCVYRDCESDSRYWDRDFMKGVCFIRFPNPVTHRQRCQKWVYACGRPDLTIDCVNDKTYICSKHFLGGNGPTRESIDPLPPQQLFEANHLNEAKLNSQINKCVDISSESKTSDYLNLNYTQTNVESNLITNILNKNQNLFNENTLPINSSKLYESLSSNKNLISSSMAKEEPKLVEIDSNDNSIEFSNEMLTESLLLPTIPSISPQNSTQVLPNEIHNKNNIKTNPEVLNNSFPLIIIPSTNQSIGSSFSVPLMASNVKNWFKQIIENEFCQKLSHFGLSLGRNGQRLTFSSIQGTIVEKQLIVDISGHFDVKVFGLSISAKNPFYKSLPILIQNEFELNAILSLFCKWKVCVANEITERVFEDKIIAIRAFVCSITNTIRSRNCELFLPEGGPIRCKYCRILLNRIRKFKNSKLLNKSIIKT